MTDDQIKEKAVEFARKNKKKIAKRLTDKAIYPKEADPVSVFMAGSPGAGKTESSLELLKFIESEGGSPILRIDPDELRSEFEDYTGSNSWLFQHAVSILVDKIHDLALDNRQSFLLDGTFARYDAAEKNIRRSVRRSRYVQVLFVYQDPLQAWKFVEAREASEGRRIPIESFVEQYFSSRDVVHRIKAEFQRSVSIDLLVKNNDCSMRYYKDNVDRIDTHIPEKYTRESLIRALQKTR